MKPAVFISSVVDGYEHVRQVAHDAIEAVGATPIMANEQLGADPRTPRNACLDMVEASDALVLIIGERQGSRSASGKLIVEEEFECARACGHACFVFVEETDREPEAQGFVDRVSHYITGRFRDSFSTADQLSVGIQQAVSVWMSQRSPEKFPVSSAQELLEIENGGFGNVSFRLVITPEKLGAASFEAR